MTTTSDLAIANDVMLKLGQTIPVTAIEDSTSNKNGRVFYTLWDRQVDLFLSSAAWPFAIVAERLDVGGLSFPGWDYCYDYPTDCLNAIAVCDEGGVRQGIRTVLTGWCPETAQLFQYGYDFHTVNDDAGQSIVTDLEDAYLIYVKRVTNTALWPPMVQEAFAAHLAVAAAPAIAGELGVKRQPDLIRLAQLAKAEALAHGLNEARDTTRATTPSVASRG